MQPSAYDMREYYLTAQGRAVRAAVGAVLRDFVPAQVGDYTVAGDGYAIAYLEDLCAGAETQIALLPMSMGALPWQGKTVVSARTHWPLAGASVDMVIMAHELEYAGDPASVLDEAWRVLKPEGRLLLVVPNRRAPWARSDLTPFGHGRPFSSGQLYQLLREREFTLESMRGALLAPPMKSAMYNERIMPVIEYLAPYSTPFCGVLVVEARKRLYAPIKGTPKPVNVKVAPVLAGAATG